MSESDYRSALRAAARGLWSGVLDYDQAFDSFMGAIRAHITQAWAEGAAQCGIRPDEFTPEEQVAREMFIIDQFGYIDRVLNWVEQNQRGTGTLVALFQRVELWVNKWRAAFGQSAAMACGNQKQIFVLGRTKNHCTSCAGLAGRVYRRSVWYDNRAVPPSECCVCGGWRCDCRLEDTDLPLTRGRFPRSLLKC